MSQIDRAPAWTGRAFGMSTAAPSRRGILLPILLLAALALAAIGLRPTLAQTCGQMEDVPCGP